MKSSEQSNNGGNKLLMKYIGLGTQLMVSLAISVYVGLKVDEWLHFSTPLFVWILPLAVLGGMTWQIIKDTSNKK